MDLYDWKEGFTIACIMLACVSWIFFWIDLSAFAIAMGFTCGAIAASVNMWIIGDR